MIYIPGQIIIKKAESMTKERALGDASCEFQ